MRTWAMVAEMVASHGRCALVTVAEVRGSAPREPGARMAVAPDGGFRGTIGGGELEWQAIGAARDALSRGAPTAKLGGFTLGPDLGQCCGGSVRLLTEVFDRDRLDQVRTLAAREAVGPFVTEGRIGPHGVERRVIDGAGPEPFDAGDDIRSMRRSNAVEAPAVGGDLRDGRSKGRGRDGSAVRAQAGDRVVLEGDGVIVERFRDPRRPVWLFGAGHVGRALMLALAPLPFDVTWIDERADAFPVAVPANVRSLHSAEPEYEVARAPDGALIVVMTHSHARDLAVVHAALAAGRFGYVGLIGSASKRARFTRRLREAGVTQARVTELVCPIGLSTIGSKHPAAIAAGVAVQLLERNEADAASAAPVRSIVASAPGAAAGASR
ncbi:MAG: xanthine dehydrogenase accessory protein XdhC [Chromatiales bacterium]|nr:xanthine dehydrogenase accessory protein XdhC [Chromatiales bacterium]